MRNTLFLMAAVLAGITIGAQAHAQSAAAAAAASKASEGPEAASGVGKDANYAQVQEHQRGSMTFTGRVAVQDAMFPWDPIPVVVTCNGAVRYRTEADAKGAFTIQGQATSSELVRTAAELRQVTASQLIGCDISADVPGFKSTSLHIANQNIMDNPDLGTITIRPENDSPGTSNSATTTTASKDALKKFDKARAEVLSNNNNAAEHDLQKAVQTDPKFADAWYQLGKLQQLKGDNQDALASYQKAAAADPKFISPYEPIAELSAMQKKWQDVADATAAALKLDPTGTPQLWYFDALGNLNLGKSEIAEASARKSLAMDPQHLAPNTEQLLAVMLANKGEYAEALKHLQNSLTYMKPGPNADLVKQQIAQLEKVVPQDSPK
ncbi:MAG TPA: tetratricopeptide repeat protein [Capsulimonadaceae bacterium]|nr:tetratricopeptide repeat protein [Capsulimonadaceae bacterium]